MHTKNLVFSSAGLKSAHKTHWLSNAETKNFDLYLVNYDFENCDYRKDCKYYLEEKGTKFPNFHKALKKTPELLNSYDYIFIPDDDIQISTTQINELFRKMEELKLNYAQAAFSWDSLTYWSSNKKLPFSTHHRSSVIENNCVCFSQKALKKVVDTFEDSSTGWGIDVLWTQILTKNKIYPVIIDTVTLKHPLRKSELDKLSKRSEHSISGTAFLNKWKVSPEVNRNTLKRLDDYNSVKKLFLKLLDYTLLKIHNLHFTWNFYVVRRFK